MRFNILISMLGILSLPQSGSYRVTVSVHDIKPLKGDLYIALHQKPESFNFPDSALMKSSVKIDSNAESIVFQHVPAGTYAVAVYHDENGNGTMDASEAGIPREGYAFSGKSRGPGRPKFEDAAIEVSRSDTVNLKMVYHPVPPPKK